MKKILLIGPLPDPITGESFANQTLMEGINRYTDNYICDAINTNYHKMDKLGSFSFAKLWFYSSRYFKLEKLFRHDVIYMTIGQTFFGIVKYAPFIFLARLLGKQVIVHIHGNFLHRQYAEAAGWKQRIMRMIVSRADQGIVLSDRLRPNLRPFLPEERIFPLYNFVEEALMVPVAEYEPDLSSLRILYLSNLIPTKGIFDVLEAACQLRGQGIPFTLEIAGKLDEDNRAEFERYQQQLGETVRYLGVVRGEEKKQAFLRNNVFVFPTYYPIEGQPIAILEAMATGMVVLTTEHAGIPDIFRDGEHGYYVNAQDPASIAGKLTQLAGDLPGHATMIRRSMAEAQQRYTVRHFVDNFITIVEQG